MDPNETLTQVAAAPAAIQKAHEQGYVPIVTDAVVLAEHFEALDEWLSNVGLRPGAWQR